MSSYVQTIISYCLFFQMVVVCSIRTQLLLGSHHQSLNCFTMSSTSRKQTIPIFTNNGRKLSEIRLSESPSEFTSDSKSPKFESELYMDSTGRAKTALNSNRIGKSPESSPVLVLNADYTPLSHAPLSLWCWQVCIPTKLSQNKIKIPAIYSTRMRYALFSMTKQLLLRNTSWLFDLLMLQLIYRVSLP